MVYNLGDTKSAVELAQRLLKLNPSDNQGVRYKVMMWGSYLEDQEQDLK